MRKGILLLTALLLLALVSSGCVYDPYYYGYDEYGRYHGYGYGHYQPYRHYDYDSRYGHSHP
jgi:hypothetical protein